MSAVSAAGSVCLQVVQAGLKFGLSWSPPKGWRRIGIEQGVLFTEANGSVCCQLFQVHILLCTAFI